MAAPPAATDLAGALGEAAADHGEVVGGLEIAAGGEFIAMPPCLFCREDHQ
jgi:hypothetical protein